MRRYPLLSFFILTFAITWGLAGLFFIIPKQLASVFGPVSSKNPVFILAVWAPTISGFVLAAVTAGKAGVIDLLRRLLPGRAKIQWYLFVLLAVPAAGLAISLVTNAPIPIGTTSLPALLSFLFINLITGPLGEEAGWRGFALPRLLARYRPVVAASILGLIWGLWHLPAFMIGGTPQSNLELPFYMLTALSSSIIITWVFGHVNQSVFFSIVFHYVSNFTVNMIATALRPFSIVLTALAILIVAISGWDLGVPTVRNHLSAVKREKSDR